MINFMIWTGSFVVTALAAHEMGKWFRQFRLPAITGYLIAGIIVGPFALGLLDSEAAGSLRFIEELALAVIAFVAGSELYIKELKPRLRSIGFNAGGIVIATFALSTITILLLEDVIPFTRDFDTPSRIAVALLGATMMLALSPASTIAVIKEVRARGRFTRTVLGVTVLMDVIDIVIFAIMIAIATTLLTGQPFSVLFIAALVLDLVFAVILGLLIGWIMQGLLMTSFNKIFKALLVIGLGYLIFWLAGQVDVLSHELLPFELRVEPILVGVVAGFYVTNFTPQRSQLAEVLHDIESPVYVAFFTLTGITLNLDVLLGTLGVAVALFLIRALGLWIGTLAGGLIAREPKRLRNNAWMAYVTQAGIALGLAREVALEFPRLGDEFATMIIATVVLTILAGPLFLKASLRRVGEAHEPESGRTDEQRNALIFGIEEQSRALGRALASRGWEVTMADPAYQPDAERIKAPDFEVEMLPAITRSELFELMGTSTDAVVAMLPDDDLNLRICQIACEDFGVPRMVVRLNDVSRAHEFRELGATFVDPTSAMVNLLDQAVRAPQTAALLLHTDPTQEIVQITITNPDVNRMLVRDLRLPSDVLFLDIIRDGESIIPNGYTRLRLNDDVTLLGSPKSLEEVTLRLGY